MYAHCHYCPQGVDDALMHAYHHFSPSTDIVLLYGVNSLPSFQIPLSLVLKRSVAFQTCISVFPLFSWSRFPLLFLHTLELRPHAVFPVPHLRSRGRQMNKFRFRCHAPRPVPDPVFIRDPAFITYATLGDPAFKRGLAFIRERRLFEEIRYYYACHVKSRDTT